MTATLPSLILPVEQLRLGMFVQLELGWMNHPFPRNRFKLDDAAQIATLQRLGVRSVRVRPDLSDRQALDGAAGAVPADAAASHPPSGLPGQHVQAESFEPGTTRPPSFGAIHRTPLRGAKPVLTQRRAELAAQREPMARSERLHTQASRSWLGVMRDAAANPGAAHQAAVMLASGLVDELLGDDDTTIRVLTEAAGTGASQHALNVSVLALMLGRSMKLDESAMQSLALGALLHDIGKLLLPDHLRNADASNGALALRERREHVAHGVRLATAMGMDERALQVVAQHHEMLDGSGQPLGLSGSAISQPARLVALADAYDRLCNPRPGEPVRTPHEAQAQLFAHMRNQLDPAAMSAFIKLLGVYPPGSVVQLSDERLAMVVSVHPQRPLKPSVLVHDARVPREEALIVHLQQEEGLSIRRSLHPQHLPRAVLDYLSPRERVSYYFAHGLEASASSARAA